jgi:CheY-like chemotaxis protein
VTLPREQSRRLEQTATSVASAEIRRGPSRRILVVDDNRDSAASMAAILQILGHDVQTAFDGEEAIAAAEQFKPTVILMDVGLPKLNGYEATRRIREAPWATSATILAVTGWGQEDDRAESRSAGCDGHLVKPVQLEELLPFLRHAAEF